MKNIKIILLLLFLIINCKFLYSQNYPTKNDLDLLQSRLLDETKIIRESIEELVEKNKNLIIYDIVIKIVLPLLLAFGGWFFAIYQSKRNIKLTFNFQRQLENIKIKNITEQQLLNSLKFLLLTPEERTIGIALIKAKWKEFPELHSVWILLLIRTAINLLIETKEQNNNSDIDNIKEIFSLLIDNKNLLCKEEKSKILEVLAENKLKDSISNGINITDEELIDYWQNQFLDINV